MRAQAGWHVDDPVKVGQRVRALRLAANMSQRDLSFHGCSAVYICRIEKGDRVPSMQILDGLAFRLGTTVEFLASGEQGEFHGWEEMAALIVAELHRGIEDDPDGGAELAVRRWLHARGLDHAEVRAVADLIAGLDLRRRTVFMVGLISGLGLAAALAGADDVQAGTDSVQAEVTKEEDEDAEVVQR